VHSWAQDSNGLTAIAKGTTTAVDTLRDTAFAFSTTAVEEREIEPGAVPKAGLSDVDRIRDDGSTRCIGSRKCCAIHDSTACWIEEISVARGRWERSNRCAEDSEPPVQRDDFDRKRSLTSMPTGLFGSLTNDRFDLGLPLGQKNPPQAAKA